MLPDDSEATMRHLDVDDAPQLLAAVESERQRLEYWLRWPSQVRDLEGARAHIAAIRRGEGGRPAIFGVFIADRLVGGCGLLRWRPDHARIEIGVWVVREAERRGLMHAACAATIRYARRELGAERVEWRSDVANHRSRGLAARLGFVEEVVARSFDVIGGRRFDVIRCSLVESELDAF